jgi:hypothetical protein
VSTVTGEEIPHASIVLPCFNEEAHVLLEVERICAEDLLRALKEISDPQTA